MISMTLLPSIKSTQKVCKDSNSPQSNLFHDLFSVFTSNFPARTCYQAGNLPIGAAIEIEVIAIVGDVRVETVTVDSKL